MRIPGRGSRQVIGAAAVAAAIVVGVRVAPPAQAQAASSIWSGVYTDAQAKRGQAVATKACASCHGADLTGGNEGPVLAGLDFVGNWQNVPISDLFDRIHTTMPADTPGSLTPQQTSDVTAYILKLNKYPAGKTELPAKAEALKDIKIEIKPAK
jgi:mono/diheme cytochrome c family protein